MAAPPGALPELHREASAAELLAGAASGRCDDRRAAAARRIAVLVDQLPDYAVENRRYWDAMTEDWVVAGEQRWAAPEPI